MLFLRYYNIIRVVTGYLLSRMTHRPIQSGMPISFSAEPTTRCNLHCPECPTGRRELSRDSGTMDLALFRKVADELSRHALYLTLYFQGEPFLHPSFFDMVRYAKSRKLFISTSTNGHFLEPAPAMETVRCGLDRLIVSLDGATQESYSAYRRGGDFHKVVKGLHHLADAKKSMKASHPSTIVQCLLLRSNQHEKKQIRKIAKEVSAKMTFKTAQFYDFEHGNELMPDQETDARYKLKSDSANSGYVIKNPMPNSCFRMWSSCVITWDGLVVPCCFDKDASHVMGDLKKQSFEEIWKGEKYREFRRQLLSDRKRIEICKNCSQKY